MGHPPRGPLWCWWYFKRSRRSQWSHPKSLLKNDVAKKPGGGITYTTGKEMGGDVPTKLNKTQKRRPESPYLVVPLGLEPTHEYYLCLLTHRKFGQYWGGKRLVGEKGKGKGARPPSAKKNQAHVSNGYLQKTDRWGEAKKTKSFQGGGSGF